MLEAIHWKFRDDTVTLRFLKNSYERTREAAEAAIAYKAELAKDPHLTEVGRRAKAAEWQRVKWQRKSRSRSERSEPRAPR